MLVSVVMSKFPEQSNVINILCECFIATNKAKSCKGKSESLKWLTR